MLPPGWCACAYRFVNVLTGKVKELVGLGMAQVE